MFKYFCASAALLFSTFSSASDDPGGASAVTKPPVATTMENPRFIRAEGSKLYEGDMEFRFISFNVPNLLYVEDELAFHETNPYDLPNEFELRDVFESVRQMGGRVIRAYTIPVRNKNFPDESVTYVEAPGEFNEAAFRRMDMALALAAEYDVKLVIPLLNNWQWMGGRPNYADFRGKHEDEFWSDPQLIADFKKTIHYVLNRVNTITGVAYKNDPSIMAWETGNELTNTKEWALEIGRYIKSIDQNHLLIDGFFAIHSAMESDDEAWVPEYAINDPVFDIVSTHHYELNALQTVENLKKTVELVGGKKPIFLGEYGFISTSGAEEVLDYVISEPAIPGALIWSLRYHHRDGGFYHHSEPLGYGLYRAYHWPGFDDGEIYDERRLLDIHRKKAFEIRGLKTPAIQAPNTPTLLPFDQAPIFSWQGSSGASGYDIERSTKPEGPWLTVAHNIDDIETPGFHLFSDEAATVGTSACYRIIARNAGGVSAPSNVHCLDKVEYVTRVDNARNVGVLHASDKVSVKSGDYRSYKEAYARLHGEAGGMIIYRSPGPIREFRAYAFEGDRSANMKISYSIDGKAFTPILAEIDAYASDEENYDYLVPVRYSLKAGLPKGVPVFIKMDFEKAADIVRVEIDYRH